MSDTMSKILTPGCPTTSNYSFPLWWLYFRASIKRFDPLVQGISGLNFFFLGWSYQWGANPFAREAKLLRSVWLVKLSYLLAIGGLNLLLAGH